MPEECSETLINDIKAFVTYTPIKPVIKKPIKELQYKENDKKFFYKYS